tara:strand:- start:34 stop:1584 length:1551 start_codon:yes stop_codon:yes gene_type:complete
MKYIKSLILVFYILLNGNANSQDGSFDTDFGTDGKLVFSIADKSDIGRSLAILDDGKIITGGFYNLINNSTVNRHIFLTKHLTNGELDTSFGINGIVTLTIGNEGCSISEIEIQNDGKIVAFGSANNTPTLLRFNENGSLDNTFGDNGISYITSGGEFEILNNGKFIIAGGFFDGFNVYFSISRYNSNGVIDSSFGNNGTVITDISPERFDLNAALKIQDDGKMVLAGTTYTQASQRKAVIARFLIDGSLDPTFGDNGIKITSVGNEPGYGAFTDIDIQADGKIVAVGQAENSIGGGFFESHSLLVRYNTNGLLDDSFGLNGIVITDEATNGNSLINATIIQPDNKIITMGYSAEAMPSFQSYLTCMKFDTSGELDTSFGNNGIVISDLFNSETNTGYEVKLQNDGKIVGIGITNEANTSNKDIALIRLNNQVLDIEDTVLEPHIVIFPNPTKHFLNFTLRNNITGFSINIFNVNGQKVYESKYLSKIDVSAFESGCYFVEIITGKGYIYKKVVVK